VGIKLNNYRNNCTSSWNLNENVINLKWHNILLLL